LRVIHSRSASALVSVLPAFHGREDIVEPLPSNRRLR
jgi:hypothetical protein